MVGVAEGRFYDAAYLAAAVKAGAFESERVLGEHAADSNLGGITIAITFRDYGVIVVGDVGEIEIDIDSRIGGIAFTGRVHEEVGVQQKIRFRYSAGNRKFFQSHRIALKLELIVKLRRDLEIDDAALFPREHLKVGHVHGVILYD